MSPRAEPFVIPKQFHVVGDLDLSKPITTGISSLKHPGYHLFAHSSLRSHEFKTARFMKGSIQKIDQDPWGWFSLKPEGYMIASFESHRYPDCFLEIAPEATGTSKEARIVKRTGAD